MEDKPYTSVGMTISIFTEIHPVGATLIRVGEWKEGTKTLIGAFRAYMNVPKKFYVNNTRITKILVECIENPYHK